jgi:hypothetical protein
VPMQRISRLDVAREVLLLVDFRQVLVERP